MLRNILIFMLFLSTFGCAYEPIEPPTPPTQPGPGPFTPTDPVRVSDYDMDPHIVEEWIDTPFPEDAPEPAYEITHFPMKNMRGDYRKAPPIYPLGPIGNPAANVPRGMPIAWVGKLDENGYFEGRWYTVKMGVLWTSAFSVDGEYDYSKIRPERGLKRWYRNKIAKLQQEMQVDFHPNIPQNLRAKIRKAQADNLRNLRKALGEEEE